MSQQYPDMYQDFSSNRSPGTSRYNGLNTNLNRQPSRHFDNYGSQQLQGLYAQEDHSGGRYDSAPRFDRAPPATLQHTNNYAYDNQTWNYGGGNVNSGMSGISGLSTMGGTGRVKPSSARRTNLPSSWMDSSQMPPPMPNTGLHQINSHQLNSQYSQPQMQSHHPRISTPPDHDELIPTAIVIKNIPFAVKKESLVALMTEMNLPLPYAFNYHFDNGVFRGLAFANFTTPEETSTVIDAMNHMDLQGRKLRVEYKKMLPAHERERIERDKRERRGQLEEQHRPIGNGSAPPLHSQTSMNSLHSSHIPASPSPVQLRGKGGDYHASSSGPTGSIAGVDMNDPSTLGYFTELTVFKTDSNREILVFPSTVSPHDRKIIHTLAHNMGLEHRSEGAGDSRCVQIFKTRQSTISPAVPSIPQTFYNNERRGLNRAATIDFAERRENEAGYYPHTLGRQGSGLLDIPASPGLGLSAAHNLRAAKSFADLRSYTPSPAQSVASYPTNPSQNIARYTDYGHSSAASGTPNLTPTSAGGQMNDRNESFLVNGLNSMTIGFDRPAVRANGRIGQERDNHPSNAGPIGSHRPVNGNTYDDSSRNGTSAVPERQPRGPVSEWGSGFARPRQNGHRNQGSGELDLNSIERDWDDNRVQDSSDRNANGRYH